ncbi:hypothetical protein SAMN05660662_1632 [Blastococcus aurantiacus]|uniref:Uncharacterized protein n=1 Tax=Blastococcus aurantiacus TaxID=1550231 RepID=A0A1G7JP95_9ACTN|nr:hypothetical protein [Blastococcus aurantiacus]SDF26701.1 hypothetical protein SAMN05660662_1632 [Blastococcus aurantiacus]
MRPPDFWAGHSHLWDEWVRDHGLPEPLSTPVALGESVPVAYWVGPRTAAVLHLHRSQDDGAPEPHTGTDLRLLARVGDGWEYRGGSRSWSADEFPEKPVPARDVRLDGSACNWWTPDDDGRKALYLVVCVVADAPCTIRVLDRDGELLARIDEPAGVEGVPRRA